MAVFFAQRLVTAFQPNGFVETIHVLTVAEKRSWYLFSTYYLMLDSTLTENNLRNIETLLQVA